MISIAPPIIAMWPQGSSRMVAGTNPYGFGYGIGTPGGHLHFVQTRFKPLYDEGVRYFGRHRPFGERPGKPMDLDAGAELARDPDWQFVLDDYTESCQWMQSHMPDAVVLDYIGTPEADLDERLQAGDFSEHMFRLWHSVRRLLNEPNVSIVLDAAMSQRHYPDHSPYEYFARMLRAYKQTQGQTVLVEALPGEGNRHQNDWSYEFDALCASQFWIPNRMTRAEQFRVGERARISRTTNICWLTGHSRDWIATHGVDGFIDVCDTFTLIPAIPMTLDDWREIRDRVIT